MFEINDELLRPYFELSSVTKGVFGFAKRMYGLRFTPNDDAQVFHPEVEVYDVTDEDGKAVGMLYLDFFPRATKQSGAWMTSFREQYIDDNGNDVRPLVTLTMNFTRPTDTKPSLLTVREVETFMHEFGHALHQLLSRCRYQSQSGTNVYRDFVEVPARLMESFCRDRTSLDTFAKHYITNKPIPDDLFHKMMLNKTYLTASRTMDNLCYAKIDLELHHKYDEYKDADIIEKLKDVLHSHYYEFLGNDPISIRICLGNDLVSTRIGTHIFRDEMSALCYELELSKAMAIDIFNRFKEDGVLSRKIGEEFREKVLSKGATKEPDEMFRDFIGHDPNIELLFIKK